MFPTNSPSPSSLRSPPRPSHTSRAGALIMRGFRRSRFHSFLRLRHREMIIGTWPMWSVHTRNETTSRRYPPEVHADLPPRTSEAQGTKWGGQGPLLDGGGGGVDEGKSSGKGAAGGPVPLASTRVIRQPHRCRRCRRAPTSTMRLVLSHTQGVSRPHILLLDAARRTPERGERPRAFHEATSERTFASERTSGERATGPREKGPSGEMMPIWRFQRDIYYNRVAATAEEMMKDEWKAMKASDLWMNKYWTIFIINCYN